MVHVVISRALSMFCAYVISMSDVHVSEVASFTGEDEFGIDLSNSKRWRARRRI